MRYCTRQDLIDTYGAEQLTRLTDRVNMPATTIDDALVDKAILHAEGEINMYLEGRYRLPLNKGSVMLTRIACDLAWYNLHTQVDDDHPAAVAYKRRKQQQNDEPCDVGQNRVQNCLRTSARMVVLRCGRPSRTDALPPGPARCIPERPHRASCR